MLKENINTRKIYKFFQYWPKKNSIKKTEKDNFS